MQAEASHIMHRAVNGMYVDYDERRLWETNNYFLLLQRVEVRISSRLDTVSLCLFDSLDQLFAIQNSNDLLLL